MESNDIYAFVLMPFDAAFDDVYQLGIKESAAALGINAERVDKQIFQEGILEKIYREIDLADIIIADMSGQNANVFYEVGYAHAKNKMCILMTSHADDIPFDLKHHRHIVYGKSVTDLREALTDDLIWAKSEIKKLTASRIEVELKSAYGSLEKNKHFAEGTVFFNFELTNRSEHTSPEIEAIYFFCTEGWRITQEEKTCPSTQADISDFAMQHFLTPPLRKFHGESWAHLTFRAKKILALARKEELKGSYPINGHAIIRLATSEGNFDYTVNIETTCEEFPF
jgi:hypothetical protein